MSEASWIALGVQTVMLLGAGLGAYINVIVRLTRLETKIEMRQCGEEEEK
jgi:hypothetical protein